MVMDVGETECATLEKYIKIRILRKFKGILSRWLMTASSTHMAPWDKSRYLWGSWGF